MSIVSGLDNAEKCLKTLFFGHPLFPQTSPACCSQCVLFQNSSFQSILSIAHPSFLSEDSCLVRGTIKPTRALTAC